MNKIITNNNSTTSKLTIISKFDAEKTKVVTSEKDEEVHNYIEEKLLKEKESEVFTERNPHSTSNAATEKNNPQDVQTVQQKEKQDKTTNKHPTATTINVITVAEPLNEIITFNNHTTLIPTTILKFDTNKMTEWGDLITTDWKFYHKVSIQIGH